MSEDPRCIDLSLVSHTNVGKTTLARTLLGREVGEVRDAAHVTALAEPFTLIETGQGDLLRLWDTPGFGDSARLAKRLAQSGNPIGWFLSQVWDRWRDRAFWSSQQAVKNVREVADVVLYLVSAAEDPTQAGYVAPEMDILEWIGKPVVLLLNQIGPPRTAEEEQAEVQRWRAHVAPRGFVREVLTLDAFARLWVQEFTLLAAVDAALPADKQPAFSRLAAAWRTRRLQQFDEAMRIIAGLIARVACDREVLPEQGMGERLRDIGALFGAGTGNGARERAYAQLAGRFERAVRESTDRLIGVHELQGRAAETVLARVAENVSAQAPVHEGKAAVVGGLVSGALSGLAADLASGGLTFGAGLLTGGLLGALGAAGLARGFNLVRGADQTAVTWSDEFLLELVSTQLLTYLAVAHFGRGRGEWRESEHPAFWRDAVSAVMSAHTQPFVQLLHGRNEDCDAQRMAAALQPQLTAAVRALIE
ncbi:MAG: DUF3482 domain-containing protein, partial [Burkholderiales bacterium]|nr:DUF3482 domain-containing protein [Burkholderiales bacterium]